VTVTTPAVAPSTSIHIRAALVRKLRAATGLKPPLTGFYEDFADTNAKYPFLVYVPVFDPMRYTHMSVMHVAGFDISVLDDNPVDAGNIDQLVANALHDASLDVGYGQTTLLCRRVADLYAKDVDAEGKTYYAIGGTYEVWTDQPLPYY
jgi:hypothetical protein